MMIYNGMVFVMYLWLEFERVERRDGGGVLRNLLDELILPALRRVGLPGWVERHWCL